MVRMTKGTSRHAGFAVAAVFLSALMFGLEISSVPMVLPVVGDVLGGGFTDLQWIMNAYTIASVTILVAAGVLADRFGRRRLFAAAVLGFGLASLLCGLASDVPVLIAGRSLQGAAGGTMMICGLAILSRQFRDGRDRARAFGIWGIGLGGGLGFGPVVGGGLIAVAGWRWVFLAHVLVAAATLALAALGVPESRDPAPARLDVPGMAALGIALFALVFYITQGPTAGYASPPGLAVLACAVAGFVSFVVIELRTDHPMFPLSLVRNRSFGGALLGAAGMNHSFWPLIVYVPIHLERGLGYGVTSASLVLLGYTLPTFVLPPVAERLALRFTAARTIPLGLTVIGAGLLLLYAGSVVGEPSWATVLPGSLVAGTGLGLTNTPVTNTTTASVPESRAGMASGIDLTARLTFLAINIAAMGSLFSAGITRTLRDRLPGLSDDQLTELARHIANGDDLPPATDTASATTGIADDGVVTAAVTHGFGLAALYGAVAVLTLAAASRVVFGRSGPARDDAPQDRRAEADEAARLTARTAPGP